MTPREIALSICEPWFNGDPCKGCECHKVCTKLVKRIEAAIHAERNADIRKTSDHFPDAGKMVATIRPEVTVDPVATISKTETVEPVAWIGCLEGGIEYGTYHKAALKLPDGVRFDLYTAPPKRKPLTPEEIQECVAEVDDARLAGPITALIRAVERKLGIGGEE